MQHLLMPGLCQRSTPWPLTGCSWSWGQSLRTGCGLVFSSIYFAYKRKEKKKRKKRNFLRCFCITQSHAQPDPRSLRGCYKIILKHTLSHTHTDSYPYTEQSFLWTKFLMLLLTVASFSFEPIRVLLNVVPNLDCFEKFFYLH